MLKNCVFKDSVNTRKWMVNAGIRAVKNNGADSSGGYGNQYSFVSY